MHAMRLLGLCIAIALGLLDSPGFGVAAESTIQIDPEQKLQTIDGFGVNFNGTYHRPAQPETWIASACSRWGQRTASCKSTFQRTRSSRLTVHIERE